MLQPFVGLGEHHSQKDEKGYHTGWAAVRMCAVISWMALTMVFASSILTLTVG